MIYVRYWLSIFSFIVIVLFLSAQIHCISPQNATVTSNWIFIADVKLFFNPIICLKQNAIDFLQDGDFLRNGRNLYNVICVVKYLLKHVKILSTPYCATSFQSHILNMY